MAVDPIRIPADRSGDIAPEAAAVQELYERHSTRVYGFCLHQLGTREEAEDATQSTFLNAFRGLRRGVAPVAEAAWLLAIARNVCLTRLRAAVRRRRVEAPRDLHALQDTVAARPATDRDELLWLEDALAGLPENQRRAILLREWQGLSYREIAAELETTQGAVETLIFRARRTLAQRLEEPPSRRHTGRRVARWIDFGAAAGWLKALLAGGTAKVVATAAAVTTVAVVGSTPLRQADPAPESASAAPSASGEASAGVPVSPPPWSTSLLSLTSPPEDSTVARVSAARVSAGADETPFVGGAESPSASSAPGSALLPPSDAPPATPVADPAPEPAPPATEPKDESPPPQAQPSQPAESGRNERAGERGQPTAPGGAEQPERRNERAAEQEDRRAERAAEREQAQEERSAEQEQRRAEQEERKAEQEQRRPAEPEPPAPPPADPNPDPPPHAQDGVPGPPPTPPGQAKKNAGG